MTVVYGDQEAAVEINLVCTAAATAFGGVPDEPGTFVLRRDSGGEPRADLALAHLRAERRRTT